MVSSEHRCKRKHVSQADRVQQTYKQTCSRGRRSGLLVSQTELLGQNKQTNNIVADVCLPM